MSREKQGAVSSRAIKRMCYVTTKVSRCKGAKQTQRGWMYHLDCDNRIADACRHLISLNCPYLIHAALYNHYISTTLLEIRQAKSNLVLFKNIKNRLRAGKIDQLVKCFLFKQEDTISIPRILVKARNRGAFL